MSQGDIARQRAHYRKGVVLGLTVAETMLLLLFALLLALGYVLADRARVMEGLNAAVAQAREREQLLQAKVDVLEQVAQKRPTDQFFEELVRARQAQEAVARQAADLARREKQVAQDDTLRRALANTPQDRQKEVKRLAALGSKLEAELAKASSGDIKDPFDLIPPAVAAVSAAREAGMSTEAARESLDNLEQAARENATLKGQMVRMRQALAKVGKGGEDPPCWVTEDGKVEYLFDVDLLSSDRLRVRDATPPARLADRRGLPLSPALYGRDLTRGEFLALTRPVFDHGKARQCRYFVFANDRTGPTQKVLFQNLLLTVEGHFYKNLRRSARARP